jgi:hypothetical protein
VTIPKKPGLLWIFLPGLIYLFEVSNLGRKHILSIVTGQTIPANTPITVIEYGR